MVEGSYCCKIGKNFLLGTRINFNFDRVFFIPAVSSVLLTCLLHGLPKTLLAEKLLESNCF